MGQTKTALAPKHANYNLGQYPLWSRIMLVSVKGEYGAETGV